MRIANTSDVEVVLALEAPALELLEALRRAARAAERLAEANYPGAAVLCDSLTETIDGDGCGGVNPLADLIGMIRHSNGSQAAFDFEYYVRDRDQSVNAGVRDLLDGSDHDDGVLDRVEAMRQYAASVA